MDRRKYLKAMAAGSVGTGLLLQGCGPDGKPETVSVDPTFTIDRTPAELEREKKLAAEKFFDEHEMKTIAILADIIIPRDEVSGSATDAGVPDFIAFIVVDMPHYQTPLRGGLKWLDLQWTKTLTLIKLTLVSKIFTAYFAALPHSFKDIIFSAL
jgi:hypothetical protein